MIRPTSRLDDLRDYEESERIAATIFGSVAAVREKHPIRSAWWLARAVLAGWVGACWRAMRGRE